MEGAPAHHTEHERWTKLEQPLTYERALITWSRRSPHSSTVQGASMPGGQCSTSFTREQMEPKKTRNRPDNGQRHRVLPGLSGIQQKKKKKKKKKKRQQHKKEEKKWEEEEEKRRECHLLTCRPSVSRAQRVRTPPPPPNSEQ